MQGLDFAAARQRMVEQQVVQRGLPNDAVLRAMREVPRENFVPETQQGRAYEDGPIPIACGQTISQPFVVAAMLALADIKPGQRVLEIGVGSGYAAALISRIAAEVFGVERHPELAAAASARLASFGYDNVQIRAGDGTLGWPEQAPFDAIVVSAAGPATPAALRAQLKIAGRLVIPVGSRFSQQLVTVTRVDAESFAQDTHGPVAFVPLIGAQAWDESGANGAAG
jgi:protein-L-isoaspartate(D-aspartate) O-methyltransferase